MSAKQTRKNLVIGVTGSVATIKLEELVNELFKTIKNINICIIPTQHSINFIGDFYNKINSQLPNVKERIELIKGNSINSEPVLFSFCDEEEWSSWKARSDPVLHIELRKWADLLLIAPLDANTLAKISNGLCDNLLTCIVRAWDIDNIKNKPLVVCPAMNTCMYNHPLTSRQLKILKDDFGFTIVDSIVKTLMCGDTGIGAMAKVESIVEKVRDDIENMIE